jgi:hypothetical protein
MPYNSDATINSKGYTVAQLRHHATSLKVADLIPDEVIGFFN